MLNPEKIFKEEERGKNIYHLFGFEKNPFPPDATPYAKDIFHNQEKGLKILEESLINFVRDKHRQLILVEGPFRTGKTHFLSHAYQKLKEFAHDFIIWYGKNYGSEFMDFYRMLVVEGISETRIANFIEKFKENKESVFKEEIHPYLKHALKTILDQQEDTFYLFYKWLQGINLTKKEQELLRVDSNLTFSGLAIEILRDFLLLGRKFSNFRGFILFLDEFERLFTKSFTPTKRSSYLYAFRNFIDEMSKVGLFMVIAIVDKNINDLTKDYEALYHRLSEHTIKIEMLEKPKDAVSFAKVFLDYFHKEFLRKQHILTEETEQISYPLTEREYRTYKYSKYIQRILLDRDKIENIFYRLKEKEEAQKGVRQAFFIKALREAVEKRKNEIEETLLEEEA